jgi:chromosome condensin MukBEF ATPase and DNA-binding subunit MukB
VAHTALASGAVIVWLNGTDGAGKTTTSAFVQRLIPDSRVFDAEKVGETLMDITRGPRTGQIDRRSGPGVPSCPDDQ